MSNYPKSWLLLPLGEVIQTQKGKKPVNLGLQSDTRTIPYINIAAFETKVIAEYAPEQDIPKCQSEDTLLVWDGARAGLSGRGISGYIGSTLSRITSDLCDPSYLFYFINSNYGTLNSQTKGVGIPHVNPVVLNTLQFPLAPMPEQKRIVDKLEELLSDLDAGVEELKTAQSKLVQYRQSLLKSAVEGTLTAEWRTKNTPKETGEELLQRLLKERHKYWEENQFIKYKEQGKELQKGWQYKYPEPVLPDTKNLPELPKGWVWATIDQLAYVGTGVTPLRSNSAYYENGKTAWITSGALNNDKVSNALEHVTEIALKECRLKIYPVGSLLIAMYGEGKTRGKCSELLIPATINQAIAALVFEGSSKYIKDYLKLFLFNSYEKMRTYASGGVQPNLNLQIIKSITIPLPSIDEQEEIINLIDLKFENIEVQKQAVEVGLKKLLNQRKNIIKEAFSGTLIDQDSTDEPANILLERIQKQRLEQEKLPKPKRVIKKIKERQIMTKTLIEVLAESGDWIPAQEAFRRCGVSHGATTDEIESIYSELRKLDQAKKLEVSTVYFDDGRKQLDRIRLLAKA